MLCGIINPIAKGDVDMTNSRIATAYSEIMNKDLDVSDMDELLVCSVSFLLEDAGVNMAHPGVTQAGISGYEYLLDPEGVYSSDLVDDLYSEKAYDSEFSPASIDIIDSLRRSVDVYSVGYGRRDFVIAMAIIKFMEKGMKCDLDKDQGIIKYFVDNRLVTKDTMFDKAMNAVYAWENQIKYEPDVTM